MRPAAPQFVPKKLFAKDFAAGGVCLVKMQTLQTSKPTTMNKSILLAIVVLSIAAGSFGQNIPSVSGRPIHGINVTSVPDPPTPLSPIYGQTDKSNLTKFSLDFPGGTPKQLVAAIQKAMGKTINVIIQDADANEQLPPLKMSDVKLPDLFKALGDSSIKRVPYVTSTYYGGGFGGTPSQNYSVGTEGYFFKTSGNVTDDSVWYFAVEKTALPSMNPAKSCRYYALDKHIEAGISVEDITTAIQTGWKMMGETSTPDLRFHKETKLLIAVGAPTKLETIDTVLKALQPSPRLPSAAPAKRPAEAGSSKTAKPSEPDQE